MAHQASKVYVDGTAVEVKPDGSFETETILPLGEQEVTVAAIDPDGNVKEYRKAIKAKENHFFLAGIADSTFNFSESGEGFSNKRAGITYEDGFDFDGKISYYAAAKLAGKYLFKSAVDTDKATQKRLFTYIDPDKYFPIYGDNSTVIYDVNSQGKFYGLFEWDKSGAVFGNYQTQFGDDDAKLLVYNRTLYGGKVHMETQKRTIYGDPVSRTTLFLAEANQRAGHSELLGTGARMLYYLRHRNIVEGSEQVRIEYRDQHSGRVFHTIPQAQIVDYVMKYDEGRIEFKKPIPSTVPDSIHIPSTASNVPGGHPVYVVVDYEFNDQDAFPATLEDLDDRTGGARVSQALGDHVRTGFTYLQEEKDSHDLRFYGGDVTGKLGNFTKLNAEVVRSQANSADSFVSYNGGYDYTEVEIDNREEGTAWRVDANSALGEFFGYGREYLDLSGYWQHVDQEFAGTDVLREAGTDKFAVDVSHQPTLNDRLRLLYEREEIDKGSTNAAAQNEIQAKRLDQIITQWQHRLNLFTFTSEYAYRHKKASLSPVVDVGKGSVNSHVVNERIQYNFSPQNLVYVGQQLGISDLNDSYTTLGFSQALKEGISVHSQVSVGPAGNSVVGGMERMMDEKNSSFINWTYSKSPIDGKTSITSVGTNTQISETAKLRRERQFVASDARGTYKASLIGIEQQVTPEVRWDATYQRRDERRDPVVSGSAARDALSISGSYDQPDEFHGSSTFEYRLNSDNTWQVISDSEAEWKVTDDVFLYGEYVYSKSQEEETRIDKKQVALAYRPVAFDWFNGLFKYIRFTDWRPQNLTSAEGGFLQTQSTSDVFAGEFAFDYNSRIQFVEKLAFQKEEILAVNVTNTTKTPEDLEAFLWIHRFNYHLISRLDLAAEYRWRWKEGSDEEDMEHGALLEATYWLHKHIGVGAGFNFTNFDEELPARESAQAYGFFLRLQGKY